MSRREVEELIKQLQDAVKDYPVADPVTLHRSLFDEAVANLGRLEQALDNRPSLIKKLNEKIIKLEGELEILRNETRVNELERKVQRLEAELQRSYATKNFTLRNRLLEIEKAYREFISGSPAVQSLWDEITLLMVEDKESLPQHILQRRTTMVSRSHGDTPVVTESPPDPRMEADSGGRSGCGLQTALSYVQRQVDKFKDYTITPGTHDPYDPNHPANLDPIRYGAAHHPMYFPGGGATPAPSHGGAPDARAGEAVDDRPTGLDDRLLLLREQYDESAGGAAPPLEPHWGSMVPAPSPLRPVSLFSAGGEGAKTPDASALAACRDELTASLEHLKALFAQYDWAPTPLPGAGASSTSITTTTTLSSDPQQQQRPMPDASAFSSMADSLEVSVEKLRQYFARMQWAPGGGGLAGGTSGGRMPGEPGAAAIPDASYFDSQADVILSSVQHLQRQFHEAAAAAAAEAARAAATAGGGAGASSSIPGGGGGAAAAATAAAPLLIPDARYFETQADSIAASVNELLRLYEQSVAAAAAAANGGSGAGCGSRVPWGPAVAMEGAAGRDRPAGFPPDARAGEAMAEEYDASVQPLVDLFSSFMAHLEATHGSPGASGPWPLWWRGATQDSDAAAAAAAPAGGGDGIKTARKDVMAPPPPEAADLIRLFAKYARTWPESASAAALRTPQGAAAAAAAAASGTGGGGDGGGGGSLTLSQRVGSMVTFPGIDAGIPSELKLVMNGEGGGAGGQAPAAVSSASPAPPVWFRIKINATDAVGSDSVLAHLSPWTSSVNLVDRQQLRLQRTDGDAADADSTVATPAAGAGLMGPLGAAAQAQAPLEVLLSSLESRHGRGLATSPEAVAVWRDLLSLLGVDPSSRPLPIQGSTLPTPSRRSASGTLLHVQDQQQQQPGLSAADAESGGGGGAAGGTTADAWLAAARAGALTEEAGELGLAEAALGVLAPPEAGHSSRAFITKGDNDGGSGSGDDAAVAGCTTRGDDVDERGRSGGVTPGRVAGAEEEEEEEEDAAVSDPISSSRGATDGEKRITTFREVEGSSSAAMEGEAPAAAPTAVRGADSTAAVVMMAEGGTAAAMTAAADTMSEGKPEGGTAGGGDDAAADGSEGGGGGGGGAGRHMATAATMLSEVSSTEAVGRTTAAPHGDDDPMKREEEAEVVSLQGGGPPERGQIDAAEGGSSSSSSATAFAFSESGERPGLVAGGVRFQITLSEMTPAEELLSPSRQQLQPLPLPQQQQQDFDALMQPLVQFRANLNGVDPDKAAAAESELAQLRQARQALSEQLALSQDLVRHLNRKLTIALESRDDLAARAEALILDLSAARAEAREARNESDMFMRELVDAKVQLAEVQGEYMQVFMALKKALSVEKDMIARIDELERVLALVGPSVVSLDEDYCSTVGQASAMATPRDDYIGSAEAVVGEQEQERHHAGNTAGSPGGSPRGGQGPELGAQNGGDVRLTRDMSGRRSLGVDSEVAVTLRGTSSGDGSSSEGGGLGRAPSLSGVGRVPSLK